MVTGQTRGASNLLVHNSLKHWYYDSISWQRLENNFSPQSSLFSCLYTTVSRCSLWETPLAMLDLRVLKALKSTLWCFVSLRRRQTGMTEPFSLILHNTPWSLPLWHWLQWEKMHLLRFEVSLSLSYVLFLFSSCTHARTHACMHTLTHFRPQIQHRPLH